MPPPAIDTVDKLHLYLHVAMQIEHATLPPYLLALYSIKPGTNSDATHVLRVIAVEEMLHLTLAANLLNAVGGKPDLTAPDFVRCYPAYLPDGEDDFVVDLQPFSRKAVEDTFLKIERREPPPSHTPRVVKRKHPERRLLGAHPLDPQMRYCTIGDFYQEIRHGIDYLYKDAGLGQKLFCGAPERQVRSEAYYSGGGRLIEVHDIDSARDAIRIIVEQGEGFGGGIYDTAGELAHFYRFQQLHLGKFYQPHDPPGHPTGPDLKIDWTAVYPIKRNARVQEYRKSPELYDAACAFNRTYADFLTYLTQAYNGKPELLHGKPEMPAAAVPLMCKLRDAMNPLIRNPHPQFPGENASPTFEMPGVVCKEVPS